MPTKEEIQKKCDEYSVVFFDEFTKHLKPRPLGSFRRLEIHKNLDLVHTYTESDKAKIRTVMADDGGEWLARFDCLFNSNICSFEFLFDPNFNNVDSIKKAAKIVASKINKVRYGFQK